MFIPGSAEEGEVVSCCGPSGGQRKRALPAVGLWPDTRRVGLHGPMAPVSWEETVAGECLGWLCFLVLDAWLFSFPYLA